MRHLLALVALLTGLAAATAPEHARAGAIENALTELAEQSSKACSHQAQQPQPTKRLENTQRRSIGPVPRRSVSVIIPTLQFGADRALE